MPRKRRATVRRFGAELKPDRRDAKFPIQMARTNLEHRFWSDWNWWGDQGSTSQCVGFAWTHWLDSSPFRQFLKPDGIYTLSQHLDEWPGESYKGTSVRGGAKVLSLLGFIAEYQWTKNVDVLANAILTRSPVVVATNWHESMMETDEYGFIEAAGAVKGRHAYLVTGVDLRDPELPYFRIKNSWGREWGDKGRAKIHMEDMDALISPNTGECCIGTEVTPKAKKATR